MLELFPQQSRIGVFRGFREGGLEFHADLTIPYRSQLHNIPMHGQFLLVQLESPSEAVLGRITSLSAMGRLTSDSGEQYSMRAAVEEWDVDDELRASFLKYRVEIRVLGAVRQTTLGEFYFLPSHRRLPHVGSPVAFPSEEMIKRLVGHYVDGAPIGCFALGEYVYCGGNEAIRLLPWMQRCTPEALVKFPVDQLVSRRTVVFARAGFGKSNLNKLLFSTLYSGRPVVKKRNGREVPVGTIIFDPDGEYFWPDDKGRPGLCDVGTLRDQLVIFTARRAPSAFYSSFVAGGVKLDIRRLRPADVIAIAMSPEKQDQQNVRKLRQMNDNDWAELVDLIHAHGNNADLDRIRELVRIEKESQSNESLAARANMTAVVKSLHDPSSQLMDLLLQALSDGKLCIFDTSQLRGGPSLIMAGLILRRIFDRNQTEFTNADPKTIPTIAVVEEAQSVLGDKSTTSEPFIEWVKEGRKYDLGAVLVTQQPGSIPVDILSQVDNWFLFHLLSEVDLRSANRANAHFSNDLLSSLLNEPIEGQGVFWSSASDIKYPVPIRTISFEQLHKRLDPDYALSAVETYASQLRTRVLGQIASAIGGAPPDAEPDEGRSGSDHDLAGEMPGDPLRVLQHRVIEQLRKHPDLEKLDEGMAWGHLKALILEMIPSHMDDRDGLSYHWVRVAMNEILGPQDQAWETQRRGPKHVTYVVKKK